MTYDPRPIPQRRADALKLSEDLSLWEAIRNGNRGVRDQMIEAHMHLLEAVSVSMVRNLPEHVSVQDLQSYGALGLLRAVDSYDPAKGTFATHAVVAIRGKILDELRAQDWAPKSLRRRARDISKATDLLRKKLEREPTNEEISHQTGISVEVIEQTHLNVQHSTHKSFDDIDRTREKDWEDRSSHSEDSAFVALCQKALVEWFDTLSIEEQIIISLYYYKDYNLSQISKETGISESKVTSIHSRLISDFRIRLLALVEEGQVDGVS